MKPTSKQQGERLFIVALDPETPSLAPMDTMDVARLSGGLYLVRSSLTQSKLYHAIKRQAKPPTLFVGVLEGLPKFKGMANGSLKWLRQT